MGRFGIYIHIPYCLQICSYCDFVKFEASKLPPTDEYVRLLVQEIDSRAESIHRALGTSSSAVHSIYFGGGTPSLFTPSQIETVLKAIAKNGFPLEIHPNGNTEVTLEVNPATIDETRLQEFLNIGINRFSVGAQTFDEKHLAITHRKHSVQDTVNLLSLMNRYKLNFSFDLLFGLPNQTVSEVRNDVVRALEFEPHHLSPYNLTLPAKHWMNKGRAADDAQLEMFQVIEEELAKAGLDCYEISNFAKPGYESRHNLLYWQDGAYWGLGTGAHSYLPNWCEAETDWGLRFWNLPTIPTHAKEVRATASAGSRPMERATPFWNQIAKERLENLSLRELLTDFCHTHLRLTAGLSFRDICNKFGSQTGHLIILEINRRLAPLVERGLVKKIDLSTDTSKPTGFDGLWHLSPAGRPMANLVFEATTFLKSDKLSV